MNIRKILAGATLAGTLVLSGGQIAGAAPRTVCDTYSKDTTTITTAEAELEASAALAGQTVADYCDTLTPTKTTARAAKK